MESSEAEALILAGAGTVWDIITDAGNYPVWDSGVSEVSGVISAGGRIRVRTRDGGKRTFRLLVHQVPGRLVTWSGGLPLGLLKVVRTFTVSDHTGFTHLAVRETASGPLRSLVRKTLPGAEPALNGYVAAVKFRAELLSFHLEGAIFSGGTSTAAPDATTKPMQRTGTTR
ncbi:SRPBCC family protein [Arthrobacter sp. ov407]|uniref:SRPBCC family protein n=1 Tax=Arthrobacter sp. ov407 TaxID=1761748 RepID=UPI0015A3A3FE|nr:SRPBCC family protein [Arthrobacter sp. ov407]